MIPISNPVAVPGRLANTWYIQQLAFQLRGLTLGATYTVIGGDASGPIPGGPRQPPQTILDLFGYFANDPVSTNTLTIVQNGVISLVQTDMANRGVT